MSTRGLVLIVAMLSCQAVSARDGLKVSINPIRRVVNLLQQMQAKVSAEGKAEEELFDKFMCYCKNGAGDLEKSIAEAETKIPQVESQIKELTAETEQLSSDVANAKSDREAAKEAVAQGKALREKQAAEFAKVSGDMNQNLAALTKAIDALEKGATGSFLQTTASLKLKQLSINMELSSVDRDMLSSFLAQDSSQGYVPQSGQITGILKQMKDTMDKDLAEATEAEENAKANFDSMMEAKAKEIQALTSEIEAKLARSGEAGVELVNAKEDLDDTAASLAEDKAFLADLSKNCKSKEAEWADRCKVRAQEVLAIAETIKILNDDDALELFKKTLPTPSLMQVQVGRKQMKEHALAALKGRHSVKDHRLDLISLALQGKKMSFDKVISMIDDLVGLLKKEQEDDDLKKSTCESNLDKAEDTYKELELKIEDLEKATASAKETVTTLTDEIAALENGIKELDGQVAEATEIRKQEHAEYVETLASDNAAIQLLGVAKNRLYKFYSPDLYKPPAKVELSAEESIYASFGGEITTAAPGGIAGTGVVALQAKASPGPPPETWDAYAKKGEESTGVITMIDMLIADLAKEVQTIEVDEKNAQQEYETFMQDSAAKRAADSKSITDDEQAKAELEAELQRLAEETTSKTNEAMATAESIKDLHADCDWLISNFEARKAARSAEVDSLKNAKAVLSGADYSLIQRASIRRVQ
jgi:DNA repair exonuclease SbcCD ATPase subunit